MKTTPADRLLLLFCLLPFLYFLRLVYYGLLVPLMLSPDNGGLGALPAKNLALLVLEIVLWGGAVLIPVIAALRQRQPMPVWLCWLWAVCFLYILSLLVSYLRWMSGVPQDGVHFGSEVHMVLRLMPFEVAEGYWILGGRLLIWFGLAGLFIRKCLRLRAAANARSANAG